MIKNHTAAFWLDWAEQRFLSEDLYYGHGQDNAHDEAAQLLFFICDLFDETIWQQPLTDDQVRRLQAIVAERIVTRKPLAYLTQQAWFMGMPFYVDERVLIPRSPFAEWIDYQFMPWVVPQRVKRILEIGTGSGCMAIACAEVFSDASIDAIDISSDALAVAEKNVLQYELQQRVQLIQSDGFSQVQHHDYDLIITNPPYVGDKEIVTLPMEYQFEPVELALRSGSNGLELPIRLLREAVNYLSEQGVFVMEVGNNAPVLQQIFSNVGFTWLEQARGGHGLLMMTKQDLLQYEGELNGG